jgi:hypothetical protein
MSSDTDYFSQVARRNADVQSAIAFSFDATRCVDELTARHYMNYEREKTLDALDALLSEIEGVQNEVKGRVSRAQEDCGIIRRMDDLRGVSHAASDHRLIAAWVLKRGEFQKAIEGHMNRYGELLANQLKRENWN